MYTFYLSLVGEAGNCWARTEFHRFFVTEYGEVSGAKNMKKEIYKRGPIGNLETLISNFPSVVTHAQCLMVAIR